MKALSLSGKNVNLMIGFIKYLIMDGFLINRQCHNEDDLVMLWEVRLCKNIIGTP